MFMAHILPVLPAPVFDLIRKTPNAGTKKPSETMLGFSQAGRSRLSTAAALIAGATIVAAATIVGTAAAGVVACIVIAAVTPRTARRISRPLRPPMLALFGRTILPPFLRPCVLGTPILPLAVVVVIARTLIPVLTTSLTTGALTLLLLSIGLAIRNPISRSRANFEFIQLVPLLISAIPLGDGIQFSDPATQIIRLRIIHGVIMNHSCQMIQYR